MKVYINMQKNISTSTLLQRLLKTASLDKFLRRYDDVKNYMQPFNEYISNLCIEKSIVTEQVIIKSDIERTYGHQLFNGTRTPSRDKVIQLAFGFEMGYEETQVLLKTAQKNPLYPKIKRDAVIIYALERGYNVVDVQETLNELQLPLLGKEE